MRILRGLLAALCALVLGAHFLRSGNSLLVAGSISLIPLVFIPRRWASWTVAAALLLGALEWVRTLVLLRGERLAEGAPYLRMVLILSGVAALTAFSGWWVGSSQQVPKGTEQDS